MIIYCRGDLFQSEANVLAHGCNAHGYMGAGVAKEFKERYPEMFREYNKLCKSGKLSPGRNFYYFVGEFGGEKIIVNMITQESFRDARLEFIRSCCEKISEGKITNFPATGEFSKDIKSLAMPKIGAGLGGLRWIEVKELLEKVFSQSPFPVFLYSKYIRGLRSPEEKKEFERRGWK